MTSEELPDPGTAETWHEYRHQLARRGQNELDRLRQATTYVARTRFAEQWNDTSGQTRRAEEAYQRWTAAARDRAFDETVRATTQRLWSEWVAPDSGRPPRDRRRHVLTTVRYDSAGFAQAVGLDDEGERIRSMVAGHRAAPAGEAVRLPREEVQALVGVLREFAARLLADRAAGALIEGEPYVVAVVEPITGLEDRPSDG